MSRPKFARKDIREIIGEPCTEEMETRLIALYRAVVDPILDELSDAQAKAEKLETVQKELDGLKANNGDNWKAKFEAADKKLKDIEAAQAAEETKAAKNAAARAYFEGKNITGKNLELAIRAASAEIGALELDKDGKAKDTAKLDELVENELAPLVVTQSEKGANPANPPKGSGVKMTKAEILAIKNTAERQAAIAENHQLFGF